MEFVNLSLASQFDKIYLVSGLRRSGNHLLIQMLGCSCSGNKLLYINSMPDEYYDGTDTLEQQYSEFMSEGKISKHLINMNYGDSALNCGNKTDILNALIKKDEIDNLEKISETWTERDHTLILSFEDQEIDKMEPIAHMFGSRCNKLYKVLIIRDILNCFSSRFQYLCKEHIYDGKVPDEKYKKLVEKGGFFKTDMDTLRMWRRHADYIHNPEYVIFNYNLFLCSDEFKEELFRRLEIPNNPEFYTETSSYGHGSSYTPLERQEAQFDPIFLLQRFANTTCKRVCNEQIVDTVDMNFIKMLKYILENEELLDILKSHFMMDIQKQSEHPTEIRYRVVICGRPPVTIKIPDLLKISGGKKSKRNRINKKKSLKKHRIMKKHYQR
jgi:hypothetical protein